MSFVACQGYIYASCRYTSLTSAERFLILYFYWTVNVTCRSGSCISQSLLNIFFHHHKIIQELCKRKKYLLSSNSFAVSKYILLPSKWQLFDTLSILEHDTWLRKNNQISQNIRQNNLNSLYLQKIKILLLCLPRTRVISGVCQGKYTKNTLKTGEYSIYGYIWNNICYLTLQHTLGL